jgi:hypothetical protein
MADFSLKDYGRLGLSYGNWQKMAGLDKGPFVSQQTKSGVAPPTIGQEMDSLQSQFAAIPGAFQQAVSGNFQQAEKMMAPNYQKNPSAPVMPAMPATTPAPVIDNSYDYTSGIETSGFDPNAINDGAKIMSMFG